MIKLGNVHSKRLVELWSRMVANVHGGINQDQEHADIQLIKTGEQRRICAHKQSKSLPVRELIVTPLIKPIENRVESTLWIPLKVTIDRDVPRVADFFRQIRGVKDKLRTEVSVFLALLQHTKVDRNTQLIQGTVDEARVT